MSYSTPSVPLHEGFFGVPGIGFGFRVQARYTSGLDRGRGARKVHRTSARVLF